MTTSLQQVLVFIGERLVKATREAQMRPTKNTARRLRSLEMLAAACVADAARSAVMEQHPVHVEPPPVLPPAPPPAPVPAPAPQTEQPPPEPVTQDLGSPPTPVEGEVRGVWTAPSG